MDWEVLIHPPYLGAADFAVVVATGTVDAAEVVVFPGLAGVVVVVGVPLPHAVVTIETNAAKPMTVTAAFLIIPSTSELLTLSARTL